MDSFCWLSAWFWGSPTSTDKEETFDPKIHLHYSPPEKKITMQDLLLDQTTDTSSVAGTTAFPLLSREGVRAYRRALFQQNVLDQCASSPFPGTLVLRGAHKQSKFIKNFWTHPETMRIVSEAMGVPLDVIMPTEIGHTNIQVEGATISEMTKKLKVEPAVEKVELSPEERAYDPLKDASAIIPWHYDSYPYVCVLMLSETEGMIGGETYIKKGDGTAQKVEGPRIGHAVMLQGSKVQHLAARARGVKERISTITSYRSSVPTVYDSSYMTNIRPYANLNILYPEWTQYRLRKLRDEITHYLETVEKEPELALDRVVLEKLLTEQTEYLRRTSRQMITPEEHQRMLVAYGSAAYYDAPRIWKIVQSLPEFEKLASGADSDRVWMPQSVYWTDLQSSIEAIRLEKSLTSTMGNLIWDKKRQYYMGDELLRQGLNEVFLDWLGASGLWDIYCKLS
ncbi:hypothetical protein BGW36DRAFT_395782 [Talaromyces proteolyticus]|uniref:Fe2OG dioxygenase domain-containing protein n=1 Tax=Talaromyces proteolyticus TaxID=1131652 RepID=A0AAD4KX09_9EURO|nr:uncharacterized protein BGW36DRAFT_395782 [Talaromyces proteolyticus]KAH8700757.1 hypothetical protein BGW36DRAFT_395782 [Talaromyces proteolyticus]